MISEGKDEKSKLYSLTLVSIKALKCRNLIELWNSFRHSSSKTQTAMSRISQAQPEPLRLKNTSTSKSLNYPLRASSCRYINNIMHIFHITPKYA